MTRNIFIMVIAGFIAAAIPAMAFANPGNPNWSKELTRSSGPFSVETARELGKSSSGWKAGMEPAGKPIGTGAVPSEDGGGNQGWEKAPAK